jgi:diguanylate cyclase (GGDEF)-like protein
MKETGDTEDRYGYLAERTRYLEEANRAHVAILDMLASSDDFQTELNRGKNKESIFNATLVQLKRILPFREMGILENQDDSSFSLVISEPASSQNQLLNDFDDLVMDGTFSWALKRNQSIIVTDTNGNCSVLLHVIATQTRIRGMFVGRLPYIRKTIDSPSLNALTITLRTTAHALESCALYAMLREHLRTLEQTVMDRTQELETTARELKRTNERLVTLSETDPLTGKFNRRFLMKALEREVLRTKQNRGCLSIVILDIDHFKNINDSYGHQNGDQVIINVANACHAKMRSHDIIARYGGEEFVIVLPETPLCSAVLIAERLRESVHPISFPTPMESLRVTLSLGVAAFPSPVVDSVDSLFRQADKALYRAKQLGRNRVEAGE